MEGFTTEELAQLADTPVDSVEVGGTVLFDICSYYLEHYPNTLTGMLFGVCVAGVMQITGWAPSDKSTARGHDTNGRENIRDLESYKEALRSVRLDSTECGRFQVNHFGFQFEEGLFFSLANMTSANSNSVFMMVDTTALVRGSLSVKTYKMSAFGIAVASGQGKLDARLPIESQLLEEVPSTVMWGPTSEKIVSMAIRAKALELPAANAFTPLSPGSLNIAERETDIAYIVSDQVIEEEKTASRIISPSNDSSQREKTELLRKSLVTGEGLRFHGDELLDESVNAQHLLLALGNTKQGLEEAAAVPGVTVTIPDETDAQ